MDSVDSRGQRVLGRRDLLRVASGAITGVALSRLAAGDDMPAIVHPRATSGDCAVEPDWKERLTVTVGLDKADIVGNSDRVIQAAIDYAARLGGGTVHVLPGTYRMRNAVYLRSGVRLLGSGTDSVLTKEPSAETTLAADSDWYDQEITLVDASGFHVGGGVCLETENPHHGGKDVLRRTLVARSGSRFKLDRALRENFWTMKTPSITTRFPLLTAEETADLIIEDIALDGNREHNAHINGNYAAAIWFQDCSRISIRGVTARNYNGDGISWQICHDVHVEDCHIHDNADLGLHPGSGAQRPLIRGNKVERCKIALFFCWGVKHGLAENNALLDSHEYGISIGHRDDNNLIRGNDVLRSGKVGVLFRPERGEGFTATGNRLEHNRIIDSGPEDGIAIDVQGFTSSNTIAYNELRETRAPASRIGIRLGKDSGDIELSGNEIEGFAEAISDLRK